MKAGTTASKYIVFNELDTEYVDNIIFTFKSIFGSVKKIYPQNVVLEYGRFRIDFTQEDTLIFSPLGTKVEVKCEAQINYKGGAVQKSTCGSWDLESTLATQLIVGNKSDGAESDAIELVLQEEVIVVENTNGSSSGNLLNYVTKDDLNDYAKLTDIPTTLPASDVYDWAKAETKPIYTANEVGALPNTTTIPSIEGLATEEYVNNKIPTVKDGEDGFSPVATVEKDGLISILTVTDKNGTTSVEIHDGTCEGQSSLTSMQITLLENVLYACAFTDASGKSKVDALIASLRNGDNGETDEPETPPTDDTTVYSYTDEILQDVTNGKFNWGIGYKLNETTGEVEENSEYAISPMIYIQYETNVTLDHNLINNNHYVILYNNSTKAFKEKATLASPYNLIKNNKGKDYYYRMCSKVVDIVNPTSFTRGMNNDL